MLKYAMFIKEISQEIVNGKKTWQFLMYSLLLDELCSL